ncbi:MAG: hypothetical protein U1E76_04105 [Planctomycetota bacterium]
MLTTCFFAAAVLVQDPPGYLGWLRLSIACASGEAHFDYELCQVRVARAGDDSQTVATSGAKLHARAQFALETAERSNRRRLTVWRLEPACVPCGPVLLQLGADGSLSCELPAVAIESLAQVGTIDARSESLAVTSMKQGSCRFGPVEIGLGKSSDEQWLSAATFGTIGRVTSGAVLPGKRAGTRVLSQGEKRWRGELRDGAQRQPAAFLLEWQIAAADSVAGILDLVPADYLPEPGTTIPIHVRLDPRRAREVEAVAIVLEDVSRFPGIATNALNHARFTTVCADCGARCAGGTQVIEGGGSNRPRLYREVTRCPLDDYLDCYFTSHDNAGAHIASRLADAPPLPQTVGDVIEIAGRGSDRYECELTVLDGAAQANVRARVKVQGAWYDLPTESGDAHVTLNQRAPLAATDLANGSIDESPVLGDREELPEGLLRGDGLTVFEELRGFLASGAFVRTDPESKDLFVLDATGAFEPQLQVATAVFGKAGLHLHRLLPAEHGGEVVNANSPTQLRAGDQPVVIVLGPQSLDGEETGRFAYVGPPTAAHHVIHVLEPSARELIPQLAHQGGIPHHGEGMSVIDTEQGPKIVAVSGGETSGDAHCVMRLRHADLLCSGGRVLEPFEGHRDFYRPYPSASEPLLADEPLALCTAPEGTLLNDGAQGTGNATYGACARRFFVKGNGQ